MSSARLLSRSALAGRNSAQPRFASSTERSELICTHMSPLGAAADVLIWVVAKGFGRAGVGGPRGGNSRSWRDGQKRIEQHAAPEAVNPVGEALGLPVELEALIFLAGGSTTFCGSAQFSSLGARAANSPALTRSAARVFCRISRRAAWGRHRRGIRWNNRLVRSVAVRPRRYVQGRKQTLKACILFVRLGRSAQLIFP